MEKNTEFKLGQKVELITNHIVGGVSSSKNKKGDIGIITKIPNWRTDIVDVDFGNGRAIDTTIPVQKLKIV